MPSFKLTTKAKADLIQIAAYTEQHWGKAQRNHYLREIDLRFHQLAENSSIGPTCGYIKPGYRKLQQGSHLIFYRLGKRADVEIIRVLHKNMDVNAKFFNE